MFRPSDLISQKYAEEQRILHARPNGYGGKGSKWTEGVIAVASIYGCHSILDYGSGRGTLVASLKERGGMGGIRFDEYDPAITGKDHLPSFADLVVCTEVLEHIEPERLDAVLQHLEMLAKRAIFLVITTQPSNKSLSDGRNAHLTVASADWWRERVTRVTGWQAVEGPGAVTAKEWIAVLVL